MEDRPRVQVESRAAWRAWLEDNHAAGEGIWLVTYKKHCGEKYVSYDEIVEEALCFGWIDSTQRTVDKDRSQQWLTPRKAGSGWSRSNKERVERLAAAGLMTPAGQAKIDAAKADGSWSALDAIENLEIPTDLAAAFAAYPSARGNYEAFPHSAQRRILLWIHSAKRPATRARRIEETARLAEDNVQANQ